MNGTKEILFLEPQFKERLWGGNRLAEEFHYKLDSDRIGECWAVSAHPNGDSVVREGTYEGKFLSELWKEHRELFGNLDADKFPLLVKLIDARETNSIQVHPDNAYVKENGIAGLGKSECWYIVDCPENATLVIGHHARTKEELCRMVEQGEWNQLLKEVPVKKGDFIQIEAGILHTIEAGFIVYETQQNSDITYRFYDYGRKVNGQERELHIKECIDVTTVPDNQPEKGIVSTQKLQPDEMHELVCCDNYIVWKMDVRKPVSMEQNHPFLIVSVLNGEGTVDGHCIKKGDHFILPAGYGKAHIEGTIDLMMSSVPAVGGRNCV